LSETAKLRAMARSLDGARRSLVELQAVDDAYPALTARSRSRRRSRSPPRWRPTKACSARWPRRRSPAGSASKLGDEFRIGESVLRLAALIESEPDRAFAGFTLARESPSRARRWRRRG